MVRSVRLPDGGKYAADHFGPRSASHTGGLRRQPVPPYRSVEHVLLGHELHRFYRADGYSRDRSSMGFYPARSGVGASESMGGYHAFAGGACLEVRTSIL